MDPREPAEPDQSAPEGFQLLRIEGPTYSSNGELCSWCAPPMQVDADRRVCQQCPSGRGPSQYYQYAEESQDRSLDRVGQCVPCTGNDFSVVGPANSITALRSMHTTG